MFVAHKYWVLRILAFDTFICWLCLMIICDRKMKKLNRIQESCHIRKKKQVYETYESGTCWRVELRAYERKELRSYKRSEGRERLKRCSRSKTLFLNRFSLLLLLSIVEIFVMKKTSRKMLKTCCLSGRKNSDFLDRKFPDNSCEGRSCYLWEFISCIRFSIRGYNSGLISLSLPAFTCIYVQYTCIYK